ncbi:MAG: radical SAM family heme chaperone HemW [Lachnospiraceae bacterium]|nr:radical SAM family heme chaperone HemW [Lachnospiraceae bacterium]
MIDKRDVGIYVHIPFCVRKCRYCDFLSAPGNDDVVREYVSALISDIENAEGADNYNVRTVYFGGGTPSSVRHEYIAAVMRALCGRFGLKPQKDGDGNATLFDRDGRRLDECTIEVNPGTVTEERLKAYREMGFDRISVGVQSADDEELKMLGRIHTFSDAKECVRSARNAGFKNLSVDIISALPGQSIEKYRENLEKTVALEPDHISSYSLIIEEGTPFFDMYGPQGEQRSELPDEETDRKMYALTKEVLKSHGYERYEISNYARSGYESRHNTSYWTGREYYGFGLGAASFLGNKRLSVLRDLKEYAAHPSARVQEEELDRRDLMNEFMMLGLRLTKGVSRAEFERRFGVSMDEAFPGVLSRLLSQGLIEENAGYVRLTEFGTDVANTVFGEFV